MVNWNNVKVFRPDAPVVSEGEGDPGSIALSTLLDKYDVVSIDDGYGSMVVAERGHGYNVDSVGPYRFVDPVSLNKGSETKQLSDVGTTFQELAYASPSPFTSWLRLEHVPELRDQRGLQTYYRMKRGDGAVRGALRLLKTPIVGAHWYVEPATNSTRDVNVAKFIEDNLVNGLNVSWSTLLTDILLMCEYGHMIFEKVFEFGPDGKVRWKKLAPRHPLDVMRWYWDAQGGPNGIEMFPFMPYESAPGVPQSTGATEAPYITIDKLLVFSFEAESGDLTGTSTLRSAYKHWYYKESLYKIDAIQKERHGIGIPVIKLPPNFSQQDKSYAEDLGRNLRTNERAHVVLPPFWELLFADLQGNPVDCLKSIDHHNKMIGVNIVAPFMETGGKDTDQSMFLKSTRHIAEGVCDIFNAHAIPQLVDYNWSRVGYPMLRARRIGEWEDLRVLSFALRNLIGAGVIIPDDPLEAEMRKEFDLPIADPATARQINKPLLGTHQSVTPDPGDAAIQIPGGTNAPQTPQLPQVGQPRQSTSPPVGLPASNAGRDSSGG